MPGLTSGTLILISKGAIRMFSQLRPAIVAFLLLTVITGLVYPLAVTAVAQVAFPSQANGSLIMKDGKPIGSTLIGQPFDDPKYFWGRLSATAPFPYNSAASSGSNLAQTNPALLDNAKSRIAALKAVDPQASASVPAD